MTYHCVPRTSVSYHVLALCTGNELGKTVSPPVSETIVCITMIQSYMKTFGSIDVFILSHPNRVGDFFLTFICIWWTWYSCATVWNLPVSGCHVLFMPGAGIIHIIQSPLSPRPLVQYPRRTCFYWEGIYTHMHKVIYIHICNSYGVLRNRVKDRKGKRHTYGKLTDSITFLHHKAGKFIFDLYYLHK